MACGTEIGAVRHGGYILWDDDIDIYMLMVDYMILMKGFPKTYKEKNKIVSIERSEKWDRPYAKTYDDTTIMYEKSNDKQTIGIGIDIFPIGIVPEYDKEWKNTIELEEMFKDYLWQKIL